MTNELKEFYDLKYHEKSTPIYLKKYFRNIYKLIKPKIISKKRLIDLGCADGIKTVSFGYEFEEIIGVDLSEVGINKANQINADKKVKFINADVFEVELNSKTVSAFGFSYFNVLTVKEFCDNIDLIISKLIGENGQLIYLSWTDFSGKNVNNWYYQSKEDLNKINDELRSMGYEIEIIYPHKKLNFYFFKGLEHFIRQILWLVLKKKKFFIILITKK